MTSNKLPSSVQKEQYILEQLGALGSLINKNVFKAQHDERSVKFMCSFFEGNLDLLDGYERLDADFFTVWSKFDSQCAVNTNITKDNRVNTLSITFNY